MQGKNACVPTDESPTVPPLVFLGPSLPLAEAEQLCAAEYHAPIRRSDLPRLAGSTPRLIGIIDGVFHHGLAVSPNEVLAAMNAGHQMFGAASMGALRAVELRQGGMVGVGRIYEAFASGTTERDDEVAVTFDSESGAPLSEALIGMRQAFAEAVAAGLLSASRGRTAIEVAEAMHYSRRTYRSVLNQLRLPEPVRTRLLRFLQNQATDLKAQDARALLRRIASAMQSVTEHPTASPPPVRPPFTNLDARRGITGEMPSLSQLPPADKASGWTSVRTVDATETDAVLSTLRLRYGVTRVAEITQLDTLGIPCYSAIWPGTGISAYSGKSLEPVGARVGAQMEALEAALFQDDRGVTPRSASYEELARSERALDPERLPVHGSEDRQLRSLELDWITGWDVCTGDPVWVPADAVFLREGPPPPWHLSSNGVATGNCLAEALSHALAEVIERDAETIYRLRTDYQHLPHVMRLVAGPPRQPRPTNLPRTRDLEYPFVDLETLPTPLGRAVRQIQHAGARVDLRWIASDVAVPVLCCVIHEPSGPSSSLTHSGAGAHPDANVAACRAITEAAQSRATFIHGVREDLTLPAVRPQVWPRGGWFSAASFRESFKDLSTHVFSDVVDDLRYMVRAIESVGVDEVLAVNVSHPAIPFPGVRIIVPGLEAPLDLMDRGRVALGWRARSVFDETGN